MMKEATRVLGSDGVFRVGSEGERGWRGTGGCSIPPGVDGARCWFTGWTAGEILAWAGRLMTECEEIVGKGLVNGGWSLGKKDAPMRTRRKCDGWYPGIGRDRRGVARCNRVLGIAKRGLWTACRQEVRRLQALGLWMGPNEPDRDDSVLWQQWVEAVVATREGLRKGLQGKQRRAKRKRIGGYVQKREEAQAQGRYKAVLRSVLGKGKGGAQVETVTTAEGWVLTDPVEVKEAASVFFTEAFDGAGRAGWFEAEDAPEVARRLYSDTEEGRAEREQLLRGETGLEWEGSSDTQQAICNMLRRKRWRRSSDGVEQVASEE